MRSSICNRYRLPITEHDGPRIRLEWAGDQDRQIEELLKLARRFNVKSRDTEVVMTKAKKHLGILPQQYISPAQLEILAESRLDDGVRNQP